MGRRAEGWKLARDPRTGNLICRFTFAGQRYNLSTRTGDRVEAQKRAAALFERVTRGARPVPTLPLAGVELADLIGEWIATEEATGRREATITIWTMYASAHWVPFFARASELVDVRRLSAYVEHRLREVSASTVKKECSGLQTLLGWCVRAGHLEAEAAPRVPRPPKEAKGRRVHAHVRVDLTAEQALAVIEALPEWIRAEEEGGPRRPCRALFLTLWETGLRIGTLLRLEAPGDYSRGAAVLRIRDDADKAAFGRELPLTATARAALDSICPTAGPLFVRADMRAQLRKAARAIGLPEHLARHLSHHDFRHARTTHLLDSGAPLTGVAYLVGHRRITTTDGYAHARAKAGAQALAALEPRSGPDSGHRFGHEAQTAGSGQGGLKSGLGLENPGDAEERTRTSTGVTHQILSPSARGEGVDFSGVPASEAATGAEPEADSGHRVRYMEHAQEALLVGSMSWDAMELTLLREAAE